MGDKKRLLKLLKRSLRRGNFTLTSGRPANFYIDGRSVTLTPEGACLSARLILKIIKKEKATAVGGPTLGADPIIGALACLGYLKKISLKTFIIRKSVKSHGTKKQIEGPKLIKKDKIILVDDVATTGKSLLESAAVLKTFGLKASKAVVLVDREEGARDNLAKINLPLAALYTLKDLL